MSSYGRLTAGRLTDIYCICKYVIYLLHRIFWHRSEGVQMYAYDISSIRRVVNERHMLNYAKASAQFFKKLEFGPTNFVRHLSVVIFRYAVLTAVPNIPQSTVVERQFYNLGPYSVDSIRYKTFQLWYDRYHYKVWNEAYFDHRLHHRHLLQWSSR